MPTETDNQLVLGQEHNSLARTIHRLDKQVKRRIESELEAANVSQTQALFIIYLGSNADAPVYQYMLEKAFGLTNPTATASIRSLVKKSIIWREQDPDDGRYYRLHLTELGESLVDSCLRAYRNTEDALNARLSHSERQQFIELIGKLLRPQQD